MQSVSIPSNVMYSCRKAKCGVLFITESECEQQKQTHANYEDEEDVLSQEDGSVAPGESGASTREDISDTASHGKSNCSNQNMPLMMTFLFLHYVA